MVSCESSKKGAWTDSDKDGLKEVLSAEIKDTATQNCMVKKYEVFYESLGAANADEKDAATNMAKWYLECLTK